MTTEQQTVNTTGGAQKYGIDNVCYDLITLIAEKSKGLEAYGEYLQDAQGSSNVSQVLQQLQQQDQQAVQQLFNTLKSHIQQNH